MVGCWIEYCALVVSRRAPTGWLLAATYVPGTSGHTWQATACTGGSIGRKGMMVAARTLALTAMDLLTDPAQVSAARASFEDFADGNLEPPAFGADD